MENLIRLAKNIINKAKKEGLEFRTFGRIGVAIHCELNEINTSDIDLVGDISKLDLAEVFFNKMNFISQHAPTRKGEYISYRYKDDENLRVDLYLGELFFNYKIPEPYITNNDSYTIPITQLFLSKLSICDIKQKDLEDALTLLKNHKIGNSDSKEVIKKDILRRIWCFECNGWNHSHTCDINLESMKDLPNIDDETASKIKYLQKIIHESKKSCCWSAGRTLGRGKPMLVEDFKGISVGLKNKFK